MVTLIQLMAIIPKYQDYKVIYCNNIINQYICIFDSSYNDTDYVDFINKYGECYVESIETGKAEILRIYLYEWSIK